MAMAMVELGSWLVGRLVYKLFVFYWNGRNPVRTKDDADDHWKPGDELEGDANMVPPLDSRSIRLLPCHFPRSTSPPHPQNRSRIIRDGEWSLTRMEGILGLTSGLTRSVRNGRKNLWTSFG